MTMNAPRQYALKIIALRKMLIRKRKSQLNEVKCWLAIRSLEPWLNAFPNATPDQVTAHLRRHLGAVLTILPGADARNSLALHEELYKILNSHSCNAKPLPAKFTANSTESA